MRINVKYWFLQFKNKKLLLYYNLKQNHCLATFTLKIPIKKIANELFSKYFLKFCLFIMTIIIIVIIILFLFSMKKCKIMTFAI